VEDCEPLPPTRTPWDGIGLVVKDSMQKLKNTGYPGLNQQLRAKLPLAANAKILIPEYPDALVGTESGDLCDELKFENAGCGDPRGICLIPDGNINFSEAAWAHRVVYLPLNQILHDTTSLGWTPVIGIASETNGHAYCSSSNFTVNYGQSWETQEDQFGTMHPNRAGQEIIGRHLAKAMGVTEPRLVERPQILRTSDELAPAICAEGWEVVGAGCIGDFCDDVEIMCKPVRAGVTLGAPSWTAAFSEETNTSFTSCHVDGISGCQIQFGTSCDEGVVTGISCANNYCDDVALQCRPLTSGSLANCAWTEAVTDETRWNVFTAGKVATAALCQGDNCDNMSYFVCDVLP